MVVVVVIYIGLVFGFGFGLGSWVAVSGDAGGGVVIGVGSVAGVLSCVCGYAR